MSHYTVYGLLLFQGVEIGTNRISKLFLRGKTDDVRVSGFKTRLLIDVVDTRYSTKLQLVK